MSMVEILTFGNVRVGLLPIESGAGTRRKAERRAVGAIIEALAGPCAQVSHRADGSPYLIGAEGYISVSHSRNMAAVAWCAHAPVGIDIEDVSRLEQLRRVAARVLSEAEMQEYMSEPEGVLTAWTLKEALYKVACNPGADFRRDLVLPLNNEVAARACTRACEVVATGICHASRYSVVKVCEH